jgi:aryl-alcohol dehydrogenase-like predicted oxidoreductase
LEPYQVSLAWLLSRPAVASAIEAEVEVTANATAADVTMDQAQLDALTALPARRKPVRMGVASPVGSDSP